MNTLTPRIEQWYAHHDKGEMFRVVAVDAASGAVEIQSFDGDVEELELEAWRDLDIEEGEAPEDWTGPYDDIETDDLGYSETAMSPQDWRASLETLPTREETWQDARPLDEHSEEEGGRPLEQYLAESDVEPTSEEPAR
jgi:hypothetical protein